MESSGAQNIIAAAYLTGAAEALKKSLTLGREDVEKNLEDLKPLRRQFLDRAESDGYRVPNNHIYNAKLNAYKLLKNTTRFPSTLAKDLQPSVQESTVPIMPSMPQESTVPQMPSMPQETTMPQMPSIQETTMPQMPSIQEPTMQQLPSVPEETFGAKPSTVQPPLMNPLQQGGARKKKATHKRKLHRRKITRANRT